MKPSQSRAERGGRQQTCIGRLNIVWRKHLQQMLWLREAEGRLAHALTTHLAANPFVPKLTTQARPAKQAPTPKC